MRIFLVMAAIILVAGCVQQQPVTEVTLPGHPVYTFSNPVEKALKFPVSDKEEILRSFSGSKEINVIFDGSSAEDNTHFQVVLYNIVTKLQTFFVYEGSVVRFQTYYFIGDNWYNLTGQINSTNPIQGLNGTKLWIKGPNSGASENSITFKNNTIHIQGLSYNNLTLAGDRLVLLVLGVEKAP